MKFFFIVSALCLGLSNAAAAERFNLLPQEMIYGCSNQQSAEQLVRSAAMASYWAAVAAISNMQARACPQSGPFSDDVLYATVLGREFGGVGNGYRQVVLVRWNFTSSSRQRYSMLVQNRFGVWSDLVDTAMEIRTTKGIIDLLRQ
jgi:hypothetical protein